MADREGQSLRRGGRRINCRQHLRCPCRGPLIGSAPRKERWRDCHCGNPDRWGPYRMNEHSDPDKMSKAGEWRFTLSSLFTVTSAVCILSAFVPYYGIAPYLVASVVCGAVLVSATNLRRSDSLLRKKLDTHRSPPPLRGGVRRPRKNFRQNFQIVGRAQRFLATE